MSELKPLSSAAEFCIDMIYLAVSFFSLCFTFSICILNLLNRTRIKNTHDIWTVLMAFAQSFVSISISRIVSRVHGIQQLQFACIRSLCDRVILKTN